jgi:hypothetical protein
MNRKYLALIGVIIALSIIIAVFSFQSFIVNNATNPTAKADSFERQIKEIHAPYTMEFGDLNQTQDNGLQGVYSNNINYTDVSEGAFLNYINNGWKQTGYWSDNSNAHVLICRVSNTFFAFGVPINNYNVISMSCTPSGTPYSLPTPTPTVIVEQASITNIVFNSNTQVTVTVQNIGSLNMTIVTASIDGNNAPMNPPTLTVNEGNTGTVTLTSATAFVNSAQYIIKLTTTRGNTLAYAATYSGT